MKTITPVSIWANGKTTEAKILNAYAVNVILNTSATFYYGLFAENEDNTCGELLQQGNISMSGADYQTWTTDGIAWDWVATELNLTITGEFVPPAPVEPIVELPL